MEIKDVNSLVNQILSGKTDLKSIAFESAFAEMVKEKSEEKQTTEVSAKDVSANSKTNRKTSETKLASKTEVYSAPKKENGVSTSERKIDTKNSSAPEKQSSEKNVTEVKGSEQTNSSQKTEKVSENVDGKISEKETAASSESSEAKVEKDVSVDEGALEAKVPFVETVVTEVVPENTGNAEGVEQYAVSEVDADGILLNEKNAKVSETKNAEIKTEAGLAGDEIMVQPEDVREAFEVFKKSQAENIKNVEEEVLVTKADDSKVSKSEIPANATSLVDEKIVSQAEKISEIIGSDKKMKVSVDVKEEKIAYSTGKLLNNTVDVAEAVDEVVSKGNVSSDADLVQTSSQTVSAQKTAQVNPANVVPNQAAVSQAVATPNVSVEGAAAENLKTADLSVSNVSQAQANGKAILNSDLAAKEENKAAVKDVYKGMSKEAVEQVKVNITKSAVKGIDKINIQLKPEELGTIEVKMQIGKDGKISAHIVSSKQETLDILQKDVQSLEKAFSEAGFQTDGESLSFSYRQQQEENRAQLKSFIGDVLGKEAEVANQEYSWNANGGLNIRV